MAVIVLTILSGCEIFKKSDGVQAIVNQRVVGTQIGDFFDRFGPAYTRGEQEDRSTIYLWISTVGPVPAGYIGLDDRTCTLRITANPNGKIVTAEVAVDNPGRTSLSRCGEIFAAGPPGNR